jgi:hypothetical protein
MRFGTKGSDEEDHFRIVYHSYIKPALEESGYDCTRADEVSRPGVILDDVLDMLFQADICVVDITQLSANVFYELAIRQLARPTGTILICDRSRETDFVIPLNIAPLRVHMYEFTAAKAPALRAVIQDAIREIREIEAGANGKSDNHIYEPFHRFLRTSGKRRSGAALNDETALDMSPWQVIDQAAEDVENDLHPKQIVARAHDILKRRKNVKAADDTKISADFVECVEEFFQASVFEPKASEFIEMHWLADRLDMRRVADAILDQGLQKYPKHRRLIGRRLDMLARSDRPAVLEKVKSEIKEELKLKNSSIDMTHAKDRIDLLGLLLDVYLRLGEHGEPLRLMNELRSRDNPTAFILRNYARAFAISNNAADDAIVQAYQEAVLHPDQDDVAAKWFAVFLRTKNRAVDALELSSLACFRDGDYGEYFALLACDLSVAYRPKPVLPGYPSGRPLPDGMSLTKDDVARAIVMARSCATYDVADDDLCLSAMRRAQVDVQDIEDFMDRECDDGQEYPQDERERYAGALYTKLRSALTGG